MAIENTVSIDFDPRSSIVDSVFDCRLQDVMMSYLDLFFSLNICYAYSFEVSTVMSYADINVFSSSESLFMKYFCGHPMVNEVWSL